MASTVLYSEIRSFIVFGVTKFFCEMIVVIDSSLFLILAHWSKKVIILLLQSLGTFDLSVRTAQSGILEAPVLSRRVLGGVSK